MKNVLLVPVQLLIPFLIVAQDFCFYNPNNGPHYHNASSGGIYDVCSGDFNEDGFLDIVTVNSVASNISFVPGFGDGTLGNADTVYLDSSTLFCITSADFDNDGHLDLAVGASGEIIILKGDGEGGFQITDTYGAGHPSRIYSVDIDEDGFIDLVEAAWGGLYILKGQSGGTFQSPELHATGGDVIDVAFGDFDGDGLLDLVATTHIDIVTSQLSFLKGNGNGNFEAAVGIAVPDWSIFGIKALDLDFDSVLDIVVSNSNTSINRVEVYRGNGDGSFMAPEFFSTSNDPNYVYLADMDGDGSEDVVVPANGGFSVLKNNNDGTLGTYAYFSAISAPNSLAISDFNSDGMLDVIVPSGYFGSGLIVVNLSCTAVGLDNGVENHSIQIFPNPSNSSLNVQATDIIKDVTLFDMSGRQLYQKAFSSDNALLDISGLASGQYVVKLSFETAHPVFSRFVKEP